jgi:hypothetical protein
MRKPQTLRLSQRFIVLLFFFVFEQSL